MGYDWAMKELQLKDHDGVVRYRSLEGDGEPIVCLPGLGCPADLTFDGMLACPEMAGRRSVLIDFPGSGASEVPEEYGCSLEEHLSVVEQVLEEEGITAATVIGHSMGGTVAILLADSRPELVARLIVGEANVSPGGGLMSARIAKMEQAEFVETVLPRWRSMWEQSAASSVEAATMLRMWEKADPVAVYWSARSLVELKPRVMEMLFGLEMPKMFVYGEKTLAAQGKLGAPDAPEPEGLEARRVDVRVLSGVGHSLMIDDPAGFAELVSEWVAG